MIAQKIVHYFPGAQWNMTGETYATLQWFGPGDKPTEAEFAALPWPVITTDDVDRERDRRIEAGMVFNGVRYQTRAQDRENVAGASIMALAAMVNGAQPGDLRWHLSDPDAPDAKDFKWIAEDNAKHPFDAQTFFAFGQAMAAHKSAHIFAARALKDEEVIPADFADDGYWQ